MTTEEAKKAIRDLLEQIPMSLSSSCTLDEVTEKIMEIMNKVREEDFYNTI